MILISLFWLLKKTRAEEENSVNGKKYCLQKSLHYTWYDVQSRININTIENIGVSLAGRDKSLSDRGGKHQKYLSSRMQ